MKVLVAGLGGWAKDDTAVRAFERARANSASVAPFRAGKPLFKMWLVGDAAYVDGMGHFSANCDDPEPVLIGHLDKNGKLVKGDPE